MHYFVGVDVGGTFTDGVIYTELGRVGLYKTPTTPGDPSEGFMDCLRLMAVDQGMDLPEFLSSVRKLAYGTTLATNILVAGGLSPTALITTRGFRDTLPIARIGREYLAMDLQFDPPPELVPRERIHEVTERVDYAGRILRTLDTDEARRVLRTLKSQGVEAVAVCFLWSFRDPAHELALESLLREEAPELFVSLSHRVAPMIGEYERTATTVINAALMKPIQAHLQRLESELKAEGLQVPLLIMQSTGGVVPAADAALRPVTMLSSGPAGGVLAAQALAGSMNEPYVIAADMGGTTLDVALIHQGRYASNMVTRVNGHSLFVPSIDIPSIGTGGGSVAWLELGTRLKVGPRSAGAFPGPVCYRRGGEEPTVTDACLVLGYLNAKNFLGGRMDLDLEGAIRAIEEKVAHPLGMDVYAAAAGILQIAEADMAGALRGMTLRKGYDPRQYTMVAYGGAAPVHAGALARELGLQRVIISPFAAAQSAQGIVSSDIVHTFTQTEVMDTSDPALLGSILVRLEEQGRRMLDQEGISSEEVSIQRNLDMRYRGQVHQITVPITNGPLSDVEMRQIDEDFHHQYEATYGRGSAHRQVGVEVVHIRVDVVGHTIRPNVAVKRNSENRTEAARTGYRQVLFPGQQRFVTVPLYAGECLSFGSAGTGPAILEYAATTIIVLEGQRFFVDAMDNVIIEEAADHG